MANKKKIRLGIDVGSAFTKIAAVATVGDSWEVIARQKAPTTFQSPRGLAEGISHTIGSAAKQGEFDAADVGFVCLGTSEPANDLLRGDLAPVGIITLGLTPEPGNLAGEERRSTGAEAQASRGAKNPVGSSAPLPSRPPGSSVLPLPSGQNLTLLHAQVSLRGGFNQDDITTALYQLRSQGAEAILTIDSTHQPKHEMRDSGLAVQGTALAAQGPGAKSSSQSATRTPPPSGYEQCVIATAEAIGLPACGAHQCSATWKDEDDTTPALINAGALPKVTKVIEMAERSLRERRIPTPLVIMRNDGGGAFGDTVKAKPLTALLSGAAAALAGATGWGKIRPGVFLDIGATSTSISVVRDGRSVLGESEVGGFNTHLLSSVLGIVAVGSGSIIRLRRGAIAQVGPRSTAGTSLPDAIEADPGELTAPRLILLRPISGDPEEYAAVETASGRRFALTFAGAAQLLGIGDSGVGPGETRESSAPNPGPRIPNPESARLAFEPLAARLALKLQDTAELVVDTATEEMARQVMAVMRKHYSAMTGTPMFYGGGGAAALCLPLLARKLGLDYEIITDAEFISAIGLALGRFQETVEIVRQNGHEPSEEEIAQWRQQAEAGLISLGAERDTMETYVEIERSQGVGGSALGPRPSALNQGTPRIPRPASRASNSESRTVVRVTTSGTILTLAAERATPLTEPMVAPDQRFRMAADTMKVSENEVTLLAETNSLEVYTAAVRATDLWSLVRRHWAMVLGTRRKTVDDTAATMEKKRVCVCDKEGVVRLTLSDARVVLTHAAAAPATLRSLLEIEKVSKGAREQGIEEQRGKRAEEGAPGRWGDAAKTKSSPSRPVAQSPRRSTAPPLPGSPVTPPAGFPSRLPRLFLVHGAWVSDLCGLQRVEQVMALAETEMAGLDENSVVVVVAEFEP